MKEEVLCKMMQYYETMAFPLIYFLCAQLRLKKKKKKQNKAVQLHFNCPCVVSMLCMCSNCVLLTKLNLVGSGKVERGGWGVSKD